MDGHSRARQDAGSHIPPEANVFLRPGDIEAVADYVIAHIKGRGEPNYPECVSFFGDTSRVCDIYKTQDLRTQEIQAQGVKPQDIKDQDAPATTSATAVGRAP